MWVYGALRVEASLKQNVNGSLHFLGAMLLLAIGKDSLERCVTRMEAPAARRRKFKERSLAQRSVRMVLS